jgi:microcystin-dependent protein
MAEAFLGEIRIFGFNFAPVGWLQCNGQSLPISQNAALFALLGTTYGGDGIKTFNLPNLQSRVPVSQGQGAGLSPYLMGEQGGSENVTLLSNQMPLHNHLVNAVSAAGNAAQPNGAFLATVQVTGGTKGETVDTYSTANANATMNQNMVGMAGGNVPHSNLQPFLVFNFCICMAGIFPTRN